MNRDISGIAYLTHEHMDHLDEPSLVADAATVACQAPCYRSNRLRRGKDSENEGETTGAEKEHEVPGSRQKRCAGRSPTWAWWARVRMSE